MITLHFNGTTLKIHEDDSSYRHRALGEKTTLTLKFSMPEFIEIPVGAWCEYQGETFTLNKAENFKKNNSRDLEYTLILGDPSELLGEYKLRNPVDRRLKWSMSATPREFVQAVVDNLNQRAGSGWSVGACIEASEKTIEFNHAYCDAALSTVANEFKTEFEIDGKQISLHKVEYFKNDPLPLGYGKGNGFKPGVGRSTQSDQKPIKRLYVQGGDRNIDRSKYGSAELLLPKGQQLSYEGKVYKADNDGYYIERVTPASSARKEDSLDLSEIYPSRVGEVSYVVVVDASKNWYDFIDNTIPENLNFNDYIIAGETPVVIFQTGMLSGNDRQFEFKYDHETRRFELKPQEIDGVTMPNNTFKPVVGDKYAIFGIMLPDSYICNNTDKTGASWDLFRQAVRYLSENEDTKFTFSGELQSVFTKKNWLRIGGRLKVGSYILFTDEQFAPDGVLIRIVGIKDYTTSPYTPIITISNEARGVDVNSKLNEIGQNEVKIDESHSDAIRYTKRRFRDATETMQMLEQSLLDNYTNSINPIAVHTMQMLVGDESLQFRFVASKTNLSAVPYNITYDNESKVLTCPHGCLQHMTLGIKNLASSHEPNEYLVWLMSEYESPVLTDGAKNYYLYARVHRTNTNLTGSFLLSHTAIGMKQEADFYHLLVGVLNTEYDGERSFATLYGFTEILPGRVTTDKVVAADGESFFDMLNSALKLKDKLQFNVNGDGELLLKGTFVQSQSGDKAPIGCYRGIYNSSYTYFEGDMVIYAVDGKYSLYRRNGAQSTKGIPPTNENYWEVQASCGGNGDWVSYVFKESDTKPGKPTGKSSIPDGWNDAPTSTGRWWMSKATINGGTGKAGTWSEPVQVTAEDGVDGAYTDFKYRKNTSETTAPAITKNVRSPQNWSDQPPSLDGGEYLWMSCAEVNPDNTLKTYWSTPVRISGEKGEVGDYYKFIYTHAITKPARPTGNNPAGWSDTPDVENISFSHTGTFTFKDGYYVSPQTGNNELKKNRIAFTTTKPNQVVAIEIIPSTEANFDFGIVGLLDNAYMTRTSNYTDRVSGSTSKTVYIGVPDAGSHFIEIGYGKDASSPGGTDSVKYRIVKVENCWISSAKFNGTTQNAGTWSEPVPFYMDNNDTERIYILSKTERRLSTPESDPYVDDYVPPLTKNDYNSENSYSVGTLVRYRSSFYKAIQASSKTNQHYPTEAAYWEQVKSWTDNPSEVSYHYPIQYESIRKKTDGKWGAFQTPTVWMRYAYNGDFYEIRYAVNGSTTEPPSMTAEMKAQRYPSGWSTAQPTVGTLKYLWMTTAKISGETDALLSNWSTPVRITPYDGKDGQKGDSPVLVYRGVYEKNKTFYGNSKRVDAVKYRNTWYVARNDAPNGTAGFSGRVPTDTDYWNQFGASFESVATNLLLAEGANIGDWFISAGRIVSTLDETMQNRISIQVGYYSGSTLIYQPKIVLESSISGGDYTMETDLGSIIEIDAGRGIVEARSKSGYSAVSYISPTGVFANRAGTQALPASTGRTFRAAIVGLGFANVNKSEWELGVDETMIAGVYGRASNSGTAPAYGGYFENLYASGIVLGRKCITGTTDNTTYLSAGHTLVIGYTSATATVYLPSSPREGQIIYFKQWWSGKMRVRPYTGHKIYDDTRGNEYYDFGEGQGGMFVFTIGYITSGSTTTKVETWLVSRWKF